jgi:hypothetical protein
LNSPAVSVIRGSTAVWTTVYHCATVDPVWITTHKTEYVYKSESTYLLSLILTPRCAVGKTALCIRLKSLTFVLSNKS